VCNVCWLAWGCCSTSSCLWISLYLSGNDCVCRCVEYACLVVLNSCDLKGGLMLGVCVCIIACGICVSSMCG